MAARYQDGPDRLHGAAHLFAAFRAGYAQASNNARFDISQTGMPPFRNMSSIRRLKMARWISSELGSFSNTADWNSKFTKSQLINPMALASAFSGTDESCLTWVYSKCESVKIAAATHRREFVRVYGPLVLEIIRRSSTQKRLERSLPVCPPAALR